MQDRISLPACFSAADKSSAGEEPPAVAKPGQSLVTSVYQTKVAGHCRSITVTWCRNLLVHGLTVSIDEGEQQRSCRVEFRPWYFWRRQGSKRFFIDTVAVDVFWDIRAAKFGNEPEPVADYFVAMVCKEEVVLLLGDLKKEAYRKAGARPSLIDAMLISKKEHVFGKKRFSTRAKFHKRGNLHEISIECRNKKGSHSGGGDSSELIDPEMVIMVDGHLAIQVKHLQWKFRGNDSIFVNQTRVEVYWDAHDWLFSNGLRHALFIFKPTSSVLSSPLSSSSISSLSTTPSSHTTVCGSFDAISGNWSTGFCLFLYAWRMD